MDAEDLVTDRGDKRQNWKFRPDITGRVASPIDLRFPKMETVLIKVPRDGRNVALPPAPIVDVGLVAMTTSIAKIKSNLGQTRWCRSVLLGPRQQTCRVIDVVIITVPPRAL